MMEMMKKTILTMLALACFELGCAQVKVWEEVINIPTYNVGVGSPHPTFKREIDMLADDDQIYPYLYNSKITTDFGDKDYTGCYLENEYVKLLVTPDLGGKLYGARDKSNDYNFIYWQPTVKPALISLAGPWTSGGIEWCFPSGHRQTTFETIGHRMVENADSSKTIWVGETEWVHGLRWAVGVTLYPGKSVVEAKIRMMNPTPMKQSQYMWAIAATHADSSYQMIYPTEYMTGHNKFEYTPWPLRDEIDISWWKNIPNANSYFTDDLGSFFGGYNHEQSAGTVFTGNKYTMIGKKFWTWGSSPFGRMWDWILSDGGGPYAEPQAGAFTDNQPDFHWIEPGEVKTFELYFYPVKEIGAYKEANENGALNLTFNKSSIDLGVFSTSKLKSSKVILSNKGKVVFEKVIDVDPTAAFEAAVDYAGDDKYAYTLQLIDADGDLILNYSPTPPSGEGLPDPSIAYEDPSKFESTDELWNIGDFLYKNRDKNTATRFFQAILLKDSLHTRANLSLAQMAIDKGEYTEALALISNASVRSWDDGELFYLKGVAHELLGNSSLAYEAYYRATHLKSHYAQSFERLAKIDLAQGKPLVALDHVSKALSQNALSPQLYVLKAMAYRQLDRFGEALSALDLALDFDPVNFQALYEMKLLSTSKGIEYNQEDLLTRLLLDDAQYYIQLSINYIETGQYNEAVDILNAAKQLDHSALVHYYLGYCYDQLDKVEVAKSAFDDGFTASMDRVFPFRKEEISIFNTALKYNEKDDKAYYYLGLLYSGLVNGSKAYEHYTLANELNDKNAYAWRNMGFLKGGFNGIETDLDLALSYYQKAFKLRPQDDLILLELDKVTIQLGMDSKDRLKFLKKHIRVVERRDDLLTSMLDLMVVYGDFETPIGYYESHIFNNREGKYSIHNSYMNAYIGMADATHSPSEALNFYKKATLYPDNLKVKPREPNLRGFLYFPMAILNEELGNQDEANKLLNIVENEHTELPTIVTYYRALAIRKLNAGDKRVEVLLSDLENEGNLLIKGKVSSYSRKSTEFRKALGYYYLGLVLADRGKNKEAEVSKLKAKEIYPFIERDAVIWGQITFAGTDQ